MRSELLLNRRVHPTPRRRSHFLPGRFRLDLQIYKLIGISFIFSYLNLINNLEVRHGGSPLSVVMRGYSYGQYTHGTWYTVHGTRHTVHGTRYTVQGTRYKVHGTRYTVHGTRHTVHGTRYTAQGTRYTVHGTRYTVHVHGARHTVHGTRYTVHGTRYTVHGTRYTVHGPRYTAHFNIQFSHLQGPKIRLSYACGITLSTR